MLRDAGWWDELLSAYAQQDALGLSAFCVSRGVTPAQFQYQRRKRERAAPAGSSGPAFREYLLPTAVDSAQAPVRSASCPGIRVHVGAVVIELLPGFDVASLRAVLSCCR